MSRDPLDGDEIELATRRGGRRNAVLVGAGRLAPPKRRQNGAGIGSTHVLARSNDRAIRSYTAGMELPAARFVSGHGVLVLHEPLPAQAEFDESLIAALRSEFPSVVSRQPPLFGMPPNVPRLVLASSSSQLLITMAQADFEVRFYGEYPADPARCLTYLAHKLEAIRAALESLEASTATIGLVIAVQFSFKDLELSPVEHIQSTHLRIGTPPDSLQDALARVAVKVQDKYFVNLTISNYETRTSMRPAIPGVFIRLRPWDTELTDSGIELTLDVNNVLEGRALGRDPTVTRAGIDAVIELAKNVILVSGPRLIERGELLVADVASDRT